jgi:hypothetical protein
MRANCLVVFVHVIMDVFAFLGRENREEAKHPTTLTGITNPVNQPNAILEIGASFSFFTQACMLHSCLSSI